MIPPVIAVSSVLLALWVTHRQGRHAGRLAGLREADRRNQHQQRFDYMRGQFDGIRRVVRWLRENNRPDDAAAIPMLPLEEETRS